jgi:hypothetical protein
MSSSSHELSRRIIQRTCDREEHRPLRCLAWNGPRLAKGGSVPLADLSRYAKLVEVTNEQELRDLELVAILEDDTTHPLYEAVSRKVQRAVLG